MKIWTLSIALAWLVGCANGPLITPEAESVVYRTSRPEFRWVPKRGTEATEIRLCRDKYCLEIIDSLRTPGNTFTPKVDIPSGDVYVLLYGVRAGARESVPTKAHITMEVRLKITGKHLTIYIPRDSLADGQALLVLGEHALELYSKIFELSMTTSACGLPDS